MGIQLVGTKDNEKDGKVIRCYKLKVSDPDDDVNNDDYIFQIDNINSDPHNDVKNYFFVDFEMNSGKKESYLYYRLFTENYEPSIRYEFNIKVSVKHASDNSFYTEELTISNPWKNNHEIRNNYGETSQGSEAEEFVREENAIREDWVSLPIKTTTSFFLSEEMLPLIRIKLGSADYPSYMNGLWVGGVVNGVWVPGCLLYTSDAADE